MAKTQDTTENDEWPEEYHQRIAECESPEEPYKDKALLKDLYCYRELSTKDLGEMFDCSPTTMLRYINEYGLPKGVSRLGPANFFLHRDGYELSKSQDKAVRIHRLMAVAEHGFDAVCDMHVHHKSHIPWDNRPGNLELMTIGEHTTRHSSKLNWLDRIRVAEQYRNTDHSHRSLAECWPVSYGTIRFSIEKVEEAGKGFDGAR